jgi:single-strand DNA-binding protein
MPNINKVIVAGHFTRDPEVRFTGKGTAIANFGVAVNRKWKSGSEEKEEVAFLDCVAWAKQAETIGSSFKKGSPILIEGRLKTESWDDKQTSQKRSKNVIVVESFHFVGGGERRENTPAAPAEKPAGPPPDDDVPF